MMSNLSTVVLLLTANVLGFCTIALCYILGVVLGKFTGIEEGMASAQIYSLVAQIALTWMVCAVFSLSAFFVGGFGRALFLLAPIFIPLGYGLKLIFLP